MLKYFNFLLICLIFLSACKKEDIGEANEIKEIIETDSIPPIDSTFKCNGYESLCLKRYDQVSYATTHNAHAIQGDFSDLSANQDLSIKQQLDLGIRCLNIKSYWTDDSNCGPEGHYLYHGFPSLGCTPLADLLTDVRKWLDNNRYEVLSITIEPGSSLAQLNQSFSDAGLTKWMYQHSAGTIWPSLKTMIETGKRLVVFTNKGSANEDYNGFNSYWDYTFDTDYRAESRADFNCDKYRGNASGDLFLLNHFLTNIKPQFDSAAAINDKNYLLSRAELCAATQGKQPNFIMIDFAGQGDVISVVNSLNEVE